MPALALRDSRADLNPFMTVIMLAALLVGIMHIPHICSVGIFVLETVCLVIIAKSNQFKHPSYKL